MGRESNICASLVVTGDSIYNGISCKFVILILLLNITVKLIKY